METDPFLLEEEAEEEDRSCQKCEAMMELCDHYVAIERQTKHH